MRTTAIIQARMNSSRFRGKILTHLGGKASLAHVVERIQQMKTIDEIIIATTVNDDDTPVVELAESYGVKHFRGSEEDVLSRYYFAAAEDKADVVIRFTADCPLIDPHVSDAVVKSFFDNSCDIATNAAERTFPRGLDTEVFSFKMLAEAHVKADKPYQREHITQYIYEHGRTFSFKNDRDYSEYRLTFDTQEDYELLQAIYDELYHGRHDFYLKEIIDLLEKRPELAQINAHIEQKKIWKGD